MPAALRERQPLDLVLTAVAYLAARQPPAHFHQLPSRPLGLVAKLAHELTPARIADGLGQRPVLEQAGDIERLETQHLVFVDQRAGRFMDGIAKSSACSGVG